MSKIVILIMYQNEYMTYQVISTTETGRNKWPNKEQTNEIIEYFSKS